MTAKDGKSFRELYQSHLCDGIPLSNWDKHELNWRRFSYFVFAIVAIFVGLPIWYVTTTPYRAHLPYFGKQYRREFQTFLQSQNVADVNSNDDIWFQTLLTPRYNVHVIFVHDVDESHSEFELQKNLGSSAQLNLTSAKSSPNSNVVKIFNSIRQFGHMFSDSTEISTTVEHFFDFSLSNFLMQERAYKETTNEESVVKIEVSKISSLTAEIDRLSITPLTDSHTVVKIVVFDTTSNANVLFIDEKEVPTESLAVASWGGFVTARKSSLDMINDIFAILRLEFGVMAARWRVSNSELTAQLIEKCRNDRRREMNNNNASCPLPVVDAIHHKFLATVEHLSRCMHLIDSLHDLAAKLEDLVVSNDVAELARTSYENFLIVYDKLVKKRDIEFSAIPSLRARLFAETAVTHPSLLEFLNFPSDQKLGIYIPLFFPVSVPIVIPLISLLVFLMKRKQKIDVKND